MRRPLPILQRLYRLLLRGLYEALRNPNPMIVHRALFYLLLWLCPIGGGVSTTYYARKTGNDANPGTSLSPKLTAAAGGALLSSGDELVLGDGVWAEQFKDSSFPNGTSGHPTIIRAENRNGAIIRPTTDSGSGTYNCIFYLTNRSYLTFDGLDVDASTMSASDGVGSPYSVVPPCHHITWIRGKAHGARSNYNNGAGPGLYSGSGCGLQVHADDWVVQDMDVYDNGSDGFDHGIYAGGNRALIDTCRIRDNQGYGVHANDSVASESNYITVRNCRIWSQRQWAGVIFNTGHDNLAYNNIIHSNARRGIEINQNSGWAFANTVWNNGSYGIYIRNTAIDARVQNNILWQNELNVVQDDSGAALINHNLTTDPKFTNALGGDFSLLSSSPAIGAGLDLSSLFTTDFFWTTRSVPWDIGAIAFGSVDTGTDPPPVDVPPVVIPPVVDDTGGSGHPPTGSGGSGTSSGGSGGTGTSGASTAAGSISSGVGTDIQVLQLLPTWPVTHSLEMDNFVADYGDGFEQRVNFNQAYSRADGEGTVSSYKGRNRFTIKSIAKEFDEEAATLWAFYKARSGSLEPFYFYNYPDERALPDPTGADPIGRYYVRFAESKMSRERFALALFNYGIPLVEVREQVAPIPLALLSFEMLDTGIASESAAAWTPYLSMTGIDSGDFDGDTWFFEIVASNVHTTLPYDVLLKDGAGATKATITVPANTTALTLFRTTGFRLTSGLSLYQVRMPQTGSTNDVWVTAARMLSVLIDPAKAVSQIPLTANADSTQQNDEGAITFNGFTSVINSGGTGNPERYSRFLFTAAHWSTIAVFEFDVLWQINPLFAGTLTISLYDLTAAATVAGSSIVKTEADWVANQAERAAVILPDSALINGHEYEVRAVYSGSTSGAIYKARLNIKLTDLQKLEAHHLIAKATAVLNSQRVQARFYLDPANYLAGVFYAEGVAIVSGGPSNLRSDVIGDGAHPSGTAGSAIAGGNLPYTTSKTRVRSAALTLTAGYYLWEQIRTTGSDTMQTTTGRLIAVVSV